MATKKQLRERIAKLRSGQMSNVNPAKDPYYKGLVADLEARTTKAKGELTGQRATVESDYATSRQKLQEQQTSEEAAMTKTMGDRGLGSSGAFTEALSGVGKKYGEAYSSMDREKANNLAAIERELQSYLTGETTERAKFTRERGYELGKEKEEKRQFNRQIKMQEEQVYRQWPQEFGLKQSELNLLDKYRYSALSEQGRQANQQSGLGYAGLSTQERIAAMNDATRRAGLGMQGSLGAGANAARMAAISGSNRSADLQAAIERAKIGLGSRQQSAAELQSQREWELAQQAMNEGKGGGSRKLSEDRFNKLKAHNMRVAGKVGLKSPSEDITYQEYLEGNYSMNKETKRIKDKAEERKKMIHRGKGKGVKPKKPSTFDKILGRVTKGGAGAGKRIALSMRLNPISRAVAGAIAGKKKKKKRKR